jgi:GntR family transcriptional regulator / MocR family aminotransferase
MSKPKDFSVLPLGPRTKHTTIDRWLYHEIRKAILAGKLKPGSRLPSSRNIALQFLLARGTVVQSLTRLRAEGYIESKVGDGTYVRPRVPDKMLEASQSPVLRRTDLSRASLSTHGRRLCKFPFWNMWTNRLVPAFRVGQPGLADFPIDLWSRVAAKRMRKATLSLLTDGDPLGFRPLRVEIANYLGKARGIICTADEVVVTSGTQHSLDLIARLLLDRNDKVWMEDPGYIGASCLFRAHGADVVPVPVDEQGLICEMGRKKCERAKLAYVTPAHQWPLGVTMSLARRQELLKWAHEQDAWIIEDDYDGEFRFSGRPSAALRGMDGNECVIYSNGFNKVLFPALRIGYLVVPPRLIDSIAAAISVTQRYPPGLEQAILCEFISQGHLGQHVRRMREIYSDRLDLLIKCAKVELRGLMELSSTRAGLHTIGWLCKGITEDDARRAASARGLEVIRLSRLTSGRLMPPALVLGFASLDAPAIRRGVHDLAEALREV